MTEAEEIVMLRRELADLRERVARLEERVQSTGQSLYPRAPVQPYVVRRPISDHPWVSAE